MVKKNTCIFISGSGTNLNEILKSSRSYNFPIKVKMVVSNKKNAKGLLLAKKNSIPYYIIDTKIKFAELKILQELKNKKIQLICLAGYMRILSKKFISEFKHKIINIHPSLLPKFKGLNTFERVLRNNEIKTGCTVHYVNKKLDSGKIILNKTYYIKKNDNVSSLKKNVQKLEYKAFSQAIIRIYN